MKLNLLFFALYRELAGTDRREIVMPPGSTVAEVVQKLHSLPGHDWLPTEPVIAVNHEYALSDRVLEDDDEVAFLPPVAGG